MGNYSTYRFLGIIIMNFWFIATTYAQNIETSIWSTATTTNKSLVLNTEKIPGKAALYELDGEVLEKKLTGIRRDRLDEVVIELPFPDGQTQVYVVKKSSVVEPPLLKKYPFLQTYIGYALDDPSSVVRLSYDKNGFHALLKQKGQMVCIDPVLTQSGHLIYKSYAAQDLMDNEAFICHSEHLDKEEDEIVRQESMSSLGDQIRTFRIAISTTGEYAAFHGGTVETALSAVVNTVNRLNLFYESELSTRFILVADNDKLIFTNASTDPFDNSNINSIITENQNVVNDIIGIVNYDLGHVFGTKGGGLAGVGAICTPVKSWGATGLSSPEGDVFDIVYVAHEIGHQLNASHSFNNCNGSNGGATAYEPGSGTTIMAYAGLCGSTNIQNNTDFFFHAGSHHRIANAGCSCAEYLPADNTPPTIIATDPMGLTIPRSTPFELIAEGADAEDTNLVYTWDEMDRGPVSPLGSPIGSAPLFRFRPPTDQPIRVFPRMNNLLTNTQDVTEVLPNYSRGMDFRVTVRDNHIENGGFAFDDYHLDVTETAGPFIVTYPSFGGIEWTVGEEQRIEWQVANTNIGAVNCPEVSIYLSNDGGFTYPVLLAEAVPNIGSYELEVPNEVGDNHRIKIKGHNHVFFDISNTTFSIESATVGDIDESSELFMEIQMNEPVSCFDGNDGKVTIMPFGGQAPYLYSIDNVNYQHSNVFEELTADTYVFWVKDAQDQIITTEPVVIDNPALIEISTQIMEDQAIIDAVGGTGQLKYSLDGFVFQSMPVFTDLGNGAYTVTVRDNNLCREIDAFEVANNTLLVQAQIFSEPSCFDGSDGRLEAAVSGGEVPYRYSLDGFVFQSSPLFNNLSAGTYTVYSRDAAGFENTSSPITLQAPEKMELNTQVEGNTVTVQASGGVAPFLYRINTMSFQDSNIFSNLENGTHTIEVQDANDCVSFIEAFITIENLLAIGVLEASVSCFGAADGTIALTAIGGIPPYQYSCTNGLPIQTMNIFNNLEAGSYSFIVEDANGSTYPINSITITEPEPLVVDVVVNNADIVTFSAGGTGDIYFSLDAETWQQEPTFSSLDAGDYTVYAKDEQDCIAMDTATIIPTSTKTVDVAQSHFKIIPNPNNGYFTIELDGFSPLGNTKMTVFDINGRNCSEQVLPEHQQIPTINISHLPSGVYQVQLQLGQQFFMERVVKY